MKHALVERDGFKVPLIGIPQDAVLETCDCCGDSVGLSQAEFGKQILCKKCSDRKPAATAAQPKE